MSELQPLIERVEGLSGPSREVDALVICALLAPEGSKVEQSPFNGAWCIYEPRRFGKEPFGLWDKSPSGRDAEVTRSIDAALSLVERKLPGWGIELHRYPDGVVHGPQWECELHEPGVIYPDGIGPIGDGATPALALILALLRALQSQEERR